MNVRKSIRRIRLVIIRCTAPCCCMGLVGFFINKDYWGGKDVLGFV